MSSCCLCSKSNPSLPFGSAAFSFQQFPSFVTTSIPPLLIHTPGADKEWLRSNYWLLDPKTTNRPKNNTPPPKKNNEKPPKIYCPKNQKNPKLNPTNFSSSYESQIYTICKNCSWAKLSFIVFILQAKFMNSHSNRDREKTYGTRVTFPRRWNGEGYVCCSRNEPWVWPWITQGLGAKIHKSGHFRGQFRLHRQNNDCFALSIKLLRIGKNCGRSTKMLQQRV